MIDTNMNINQNHLNKQNGDADEEWHILFPRYQSMGKMVSMIY